MPPSTGCWATSSKLRSARRARRRPRAAFSFPPCLTGVAHVPVPHPRLAAARAGLRRERRLDLRRGQAQRDHHRQGPGPWRPQPDGRPAGHRPGRGYRRFPRRPRRLLPPGCGRWRSGDVRCPVRGSGQVTEDHAARRRRGARVRQRVRGSRGRQGRYLDHAESRAHRKDGSAGAGRHRDQRAAGAMGNIRRHAGHDRGAAELERQRCALRRNQRELRRPAVDAERSRPARQRPFP